MSRASHDHLRARKPDVRPFILTRSGFGGIQRAGAAIWSGDVAARWDDLRDQISAGINFSMSGVPNWSHDIGGFAIEDRLLEAATRRDLAEWRELNMRWFQFGAFSPLFRSHGENIQARDLRDVAGRLADLRSMVWYDRLRYRLMPYIYTLGADTYFKDGTIMRGLVMDFAADRSAWGVDDEYLFGPAFLVAPVTEFKARAPQGLSARRHRLVRFLHRPAHRRRADDHRRRAVRAHAAVRPRRLDRADRPCDPAYRRGPARRR